MHATDNDAIAAPDAVSDANSEFETLLALLGMDAKCSQPYTNEERFLQDYTFGSNPKINDLLRDLRGELAKFEFMRDRGLAITTNTMRNGMPTVLQVTRMAYSRLMIESYLYSCHLTRFHYMGLTGLEKDKICDVQKTIDLLVEIDAVKKLIESGKISP